MKCVTTLYLSICVILILLPNKLLHEMPTVSISGLENVYHYIMFPVLIL